MSINTSSYETTIQQLKANKRSAPLNLSLLGFFVKRHRILILVIILSVIAMSAMIIAMWPLFLDDGLQEMLDQLAASIPGLDAGVFSMTLGQYLETQWISVYWLPLAGAVMIVMSVRALSGAVVDGTLETIFSTPLKRTTFLNTLVLALFLIAGVLSAATIVPLALLAPVFEAEISVEAVLILFATCWLVLFVFGLMVMALSSWLRGAGVAAGLAVAIVLVLLILYIVIPAVEALEFLEFISLFQLWGTGAIIDGEVINAGLWVWLAVVGIASLVLSYVGFLRRDIS